MSASLEQFVVSNDGYTFPVENVLTGRGFITGKSGSGKSNTASVIIEELLERNLGLLIVDTDGEYVGLKEEYDLLHAGADDRCDVTIGVTDANKLTKYALEDRIPILLDVSTYDGEEETDAVLYAVVDSLFDAEHEYRIPFLVLLEEAHEFLPQQGGRGSSELKTLLIRVAKRGRKRGLGICCLSQRPAAVDKDYITQCNWFVWHRLTWENDTAVVGRILGDQAETDVQTLDNGEAIVMTDWDESTDRVQFRRKRTADIGATPSLDNLDFSSNTATLHRITGSGEVSEEAISESGNDGAGREADDDGYSDAKDELGYAADDDDFDFDDGTAYGHESESESESEDGTDSPSKDLDDGADGNDDDVESDTAVGDVVGAGRDETGRDDAGARADADDVGDNDDRSVGSNRDDESAGRSGNERSPSIDRDGNAMAANGAVELSGGAVPGRDHRNRVEPTRKSQTSSPNFRAGEAGNREFTYGASNASHGNREFERNRPSLKRRRERHQTPNDTADPVWEIGAMIVYLYDYLVWYHLYVVYVLETTFSERIRHFRSKPVPVSPRRQRRSVVSICSRLLAIGVVLSLYAIVGYAIVTVV